MIPTEHEYTVATHAAAEASYERYRRTHPEVTLPPWGELEKGNRLKHTFLENALPLVDAAISAIPDRRSDAWVEIRALHEKSTFTADEIYEVLRGQRG